VAFAYSHLIVGAGLIGSYIGGCLASRGHNVCFYDRSGNKDASTLKLTDYLGHSEANIVIPNVSVSSHLRDSSSQPSFSFIWLTVKCHSVIAALPDIEPWLDRKTIILCCQNGLDSDKLVKQRFNQNVVLRAMVPFNVVELSPQHFHKSSQGELVVEASPDIANFIDKFESPLLSLITSQNISDVLWAKLQLNLSNCVNAIADIPIKEMLEQRGFRLIIADLMDELLKICKKQGVRLPKLTAVQGAFIPLILRLPDRLFLAVAHKMLAIDPNARTSMWHDINEGKPTEVEFLNGKVVEYGNQLSVDTPINQRLVTLIKEIENGQLKQGMSSAELRRLIKDSNNLTAKGN
jgi:2-dehydropantoate 2-reductase